MIKIIFIILFFLAGGGGFAVFGDFGFSLLSTFELLLGLVWWRGSWGYGSHVGM
jgi:hypothetical protein